MHVCVCVSVCVCVCTRQELLAEKRGLQSKRAEAEAAGQVALEAQREEGKVRCAAARQEHAAASEARATAEAEARQASELLERLQVHMQCAHAARTCSVHTAV